jgi:hypothetical protein
VLHCVIAFSQRNHQHLHLASQTVANLQEKSEIPHSTKMANSRRNLAALSSSFVAGTHWLSIIEPENPTRVNPVSYKYIRQPPTVTYNIRFKPSSHHGHPANLTQANVGSEECPWFFLLDECTDDFQCADVDWQWSLIVPKS